MTVVQQMRRTYMLLRWYDSHVIFCTSKGYEVPEEDFKLAMQLQSEMATLQAEALKNKKRKKKSYVRKKHTD